MCIEEAEERYQKSVKDYEEICSKIRHWKRILENCQGRFCLESVESGDKIRYYNSLLPQATRNMDALKKILEIEKNLVAKEIEKLYK